MIISFPNKKRLGIIILLVIVLGLASLGIVRFVQMSGEIARLKTTPQEAIQAETTKLVEQVKKLMAVPSDELPTVATVSDVEKLKTNVFFANAQNGDKVLIYTAAKKAIIYRPSTSQIIEVSPISIGTASGMLAQKTLGFVLFNGTNVTGLTKKYDSQLKEKIPSAEVLDRDNAKKKDYEKSLLIDLKGTRAEQVIEFAKLLNLEVSQLPEGETKPEADFLIILGNDKQ